MKNNLIVQVDIPRNQMLGKGGAWKYVPEVYEASKQSVSTYADIIGADYYLITEPQINFVHPTYERFHIFRKQFDHYDTVLYIDSDVVVSTESPNIFEQYNGGFVAYNVMRILKDFKRMAIKANTENPRQAAIEMELPYIPQTFLENYYFNAGVFMACSQTRKYLSPLLKEYIWNAPIADQTCLNSMIALEDEINYTHMSMEWNALVGFCATHKDRVTLCRNSNFIHFIGHSKDYYPELKQYIMNK